MARTLMGMDVHEAAIQRLAVLYQEGHRLVVSFSAGKDSGVCLEVAIEAARMTGRLPVDVLMRDEEIMFPGTFEYARRVAERDEVRFCWLVANQPIINIFDRHQPYWWVFDPDLDPSEWVRQPPEDAYYHPHKDIQRMVTHDLFPPDPGKDLYSVIGMRVQESRGRMYGIHSSGGYLTKPNKYGVRYCRPIYDWTDGDVWKAHHDGGWDYNSAYDVMVKMGLPRPRIRIAPPTMAIAGLDQLAMAQRAWPQWFDKVCKRCPGMRTAAQYGRRAVEPPHRPGESWRDTFHRECIGERTPQWIKDRAFITMSRITRAHSRHATTDLPEVENCQTCLPYLGSWRGLCRALYTGDPFSMRVAALPYMEPEYFRPGKGTWGGSPSW